MIYAQGVISDGRGGGGLFGGEGVGSDDIRHALRIALRDENIKAIVIRIDSPGGSALASEAMWQAVRHAAASKPIVVSIGAMAASGGYYLASASDTIFADPTAIVGSIGVVGGKFVLKDLFGKIGLNTQAFTRGRNADLFSSSQPFNDRQRQMVTQWMKETYTQFTQRIMTTRKGKIADIDKIARGRIFLAANAKALGMVDEIGGADAAIQFAAAKVNLKADQYDVRAIPGPRTFADFFTGGGESQTPVSGATMQISPDSILGALSPSTRRVLCQQLQFLQLLQQRPVILAAPFIVTTR
jgi:protease-4